MSYLLNCAVFEYNGENSERILQNVLASVLRFGPESNRLDEPLEGREEVDLTVLLVSELLAGLEV